MSKKATVARIRGLKKEFGVGSAEAFRVIKQDRTQDEIGREAAEIGRLPVVPTGASVGRICEKLLSFSRDILDCLLNDLVITDNLLLKDQFLTLSDWFEGSGIIKVNYPSAVALVCQQLGVDIQEDSESRYAQFICSVATTKPIYRVTNATRWISLADLRQWLKHKTDLFEEPGSLKYQTSVNDFITTGYNFNLLSEEDFKNSQINPRAALVKLAQIHSKILQDRMLSHESWRLSRLNISVVRLFQNSRLYERAQRELTLGYPAVGRLIAISYVVSETKLYDSRIDANEVERILEWISHQLNAARERLRSLEMHNAPRVVIDLDRGLIRKYEYLIKVIKQNRTWMLKFFAS